MKTAMQELIDELNRLERDGLIHILKSPVGDDMLENILRFLLEKEKEQIVDAYRIASINNATNEDMQNIKPEYWQVNAQMWYDKHYD